ncbi:hypothetical protein ACLB2K_076643 [Fragaria x ananassa]
MFRASYIHEVWSSSGTADPSIYPALNMLHDVFPYASRYEEEVVDDDAPNVNEAVGMSHYEKYNRLLEQAQTPVLPESHYKTKKILGDISLDYVKIHACKNNCLLFYGDYKHVVYCPICNGPRYDDEASSDKRKLVPMKVPRYFPLTPRLQRLYMSSETAEEMRWHGLPREDDVNTSTSWYEHAPFVLVIQAKQVFYLDDPKAGGGWKVVNVMEHRSIFNATTLEGGRVEQNIENVAIEPYEEPLTSDIPDTSNIRINNDIHFPQGEYIPISGLGFDFDSLPYIPPSHDFINDEDEDEILEDDLEDPDYDEDSD